MERKEPPAPRPQPGARERSPAGSCTPPADENLPSAPGAAAWLLKLNYFGLRASGRLEGSLEK